MQLTVIMTVVWAGACAASAGNASETAIQFVSGFYLEPPAPNDTVAYTRELISQGGNPGLALALLKGLTTQVTAIISTYRYAFAMKQIWDDDASVLLCYLKWKSMIRNSKTRSMLELQDCKALTVTHMCAGGMCLLLYHYSMRVHKQLTR